ncbi:HMG-Y-related protein A-like [Nicotiana tabacum]|uniref:HMG-Y-related protein A n=1 Tax=Nicotiana tabacum TaxID=4097 RepID=A0A1S4CDH7_TOBAC|nr:HMG-Y-related protein A-like [Nicotiana tomentosiformis]XP_016499272.1 PREDICTED: HMG-Y-related protein A-like [Nicotiana tabacum]
MATELVNKTQTHLEYPEMIYEALDALQQKEGSNKSSISKYIESKYGILNDTHSKLLTYHLDRMKQTGELIFLKNNYIKPGPNVPPKRGRGRPPKPKTALPQDTEIAAPKPRGRPKKDPNAPPTPKKLKPTIVPSNLANPVSKTGRPRGRPRKVMPQQAQNGVE